jgi:C1A family cysteine protease
LALAVSLSFALSFNNNLDAQMRQRFERFIVEHGKQYATLEEKEHRFAVFSQNVYEAEERTRRSPMATFGVTKFSDLTKEEFAAKYLMPKDVPQKQAGIEVVGYNQNFVAVPESFDWRQTKGIVSPVKDQEQCGSCYIFSATETVESVWAKAKNSLPILSEQQSVDCDTNDSGCGGGWPYNVYDYMVSAGGIESEKAYPYTGEDGTCTFNAQNVDAKISSWKYVTQNLDENVMQNFLYTNSPLSVCVDASAWSSYTGGVITAGDCTTSLDHCVQATGWSVQKDPTGNNVTVWNIRNSWNTNWGLEGYIYLEFGTNTCGVASVVTVPTL